MTQVLLIGTFETKQDELAYLTDALRRNGLDVEPVDVSLGAGGTVLSGAEKLERMAQRAEEAANHIAAHCEECYVALGVGGGTGGEIVLAALRGLPAVYPKVLITTMAFDPRAALADSAITLVPTLCDIEGLNPILRQVFENTAAMVAGLYRAQIAPATDARAIAVTTLGATGRAGSEVARLLREAAFEATVFHANGYGGAAFARFVDEGRVEGIIDLNVHELGRIRLAGAHVPMPKRFSSGAGIPKITLPGGLNFIGLGEIKTLTGEHRDRPHYRHSAYFTHVKLTEGEMTDQATALAETLNAAPKPGHVILPMGGFSHEDRPGGAIEDTRLRDIAAEVLEAEAQNYTTERVPHHINTTETAQAAVGALSERMQDA